MTMRECARLQSMGRLRHLPLTHSLGFKALGNAVNVDVVKAVAKRLLSAIPKQQKVPSKNRKKRTTARHEVRGEFARAA